MSFVGKDGVIYADSQEFIDHATDGLDAVLLAAGWERSTLGEELDGTVGSEDRVYFSSGESGTEHFFLRVKHDDVTNRVYICGYGEWRITGSLSGAGFNQVGKLEVSPITGIQLFAANLKGYISASKDFLVIVAGETLTPASYNKFSFSLCDRVIPEQRAFTTTLAAPITGANTIGDSVLYVASDTDFDNIQVGQNLWLVNVPSGAYTALATEKVEVAMIDAPARKVHLAAPLTSDYDFGALLSLAPQPIYLRGDIGQNWSDSEVYGINTPVTYGANPSFYMQNKVMTVAVDPYGNILFSEFVLYDTDFYYGVAKGIFGGRAGSTSDEDALEVGNETYRIFNETITTVIMRVN